MQADLAALDLISHREAHPTDLNFILATWIRGCYFGLPCLQLINYPIFAPRYEKLIKKILERPAVQVNIACLKEDADVILAYAVVEEDILHWAYTKQAWRKMGLIHQLLPKPIKFCSHLTTMGANIKPMDWVFNPFLAISRE